MAPVLQELANRPSLFDVHNIISWQHGELLTPLLRLFEIEVHRGLDVSRERQTLDELMFRLLRELAPALSEISPDLVLVQGDTATAFAGALCAHHHRIPVVHIEAGLRSGNRYSPFPEEMYRQLITKLSACHMAATSLNVQNLRADGVPQDRIYLTGNTVVDALKWVLATTKPSQQLGELLDWQQGSRLIVVTAHRRENLGPTMRQQLKVLRDFVARHEDVVLVFPVHPNPAVRAECERIDMSGPRIRLIDPLIYPDFIHLVSRAWLVASDSGGVQEEVPTLGKLLLVLRENTERPEVISSGFGRLVGSSPLLLANMLEDLAANNSWEEKTSSAANPFGNGKAGEAIVNAIAEILGERNHAKLRHDRFAQMVSEDSD